MALARQLLVLACYALRGEFQWPNGKAANAVTSSQASTIIAATAAKPPALRSGRL